MSDLRKYNALVGCCVEQSMEDFRWKITVRFYVVRCFQGSLEGCGTSLFRKDDFTLSTQSLEREKAGAEHLGGATKLHTGDTALETRWIHCTRKTTQMPKQQILKMFCKWSARK